MFGVSVREDGLEIIADFLASCDVVFVLGLVLEDIKLCLLFLADLECVVGFITSRLGYPLAPLGRWMDGVEWVVRDGGVGFRGGKTWGVFSDATFEQRSEVVGVCHARVSVGWG